MASASAPVEPGDMECPVCHEDFCQPKILPCAHLLCRDCLVTWLKSEGEAQCPLCRCAIVDKGERGVKSCDEVADGLPTDVGMVALVDSVGILREQHTCQVCVSSPAVSICLNCGDLMCRACAAGHLRTSVARHHTTEDLSNLTAERLAASRPLACSAHNDEACKLFCPTHGVAICHLCAAAKHRACTEVTELEEKVKEACRMLSQLAAMLSTGESKLERAIHELDQHLIETEKNTQSALIDIDAACERLHKSIETCRRRLKEMVLSAKSDIAAAVSVGKSVLVERRGKLKSHRRVVERTKMTSPRWYLGDMTTSLKCRVNDLDHSTNLPQNAKAISKLTLRIDPEALSRIEKELAELGQVNVVTAVVSVQPQQPAVREWRFHDNHGKNITLSNGQQTAERTGGLEYGLVVSCEQMMVNTLCEVQVEQVDIRYKPSGHILTGVVTADPASFSCYDVAHALDLSSAYWICGTHVMSPGDEWVQSNVGAALGSVGVGGRVGVVMDAARCLHVYVNGRDEGVAFRDVPQPCYAFFDLSYYWKKVTALPTTTVTIN